jgi:hypothetical protein
LSTVYPVGSAATVCLNRIPFVTLGDYLSDFNVSGPYVSLKGLGVTPVSLTSPFTDQPGTQWYDSWSFNPFILKEFLSMSHFMTGMLPGAVSNQPYLVAFDPTDGTCVRALNGFTPVGSMPNKIVNYKAWNNGNTIIPEFNLISIGTGNAPPSMIAGRGGHRIRYGIWGFRDAFVSDVGTTQIPVLVVQSQATTTAALQVWVSPMSDPLGSINLEQLFRG